MQVRNDPARVERDRSPSSTSICSSTRSTASVSPDHGVVFAAGVPIVFEPFDSPFGRTFTFTDPDCYAVTIHG